MKAAVISHPGSMNITEVPIPTPSGDQALIRVESCGVCASNLPRWEGKPWFTYPTAPGELGHEGLGRIVELGRKVAHWRLGERVAFLS
jgi:threonine dehydrogenase-like Zn-dependent dehydrogenase